MFNLAHLKRGNIFGNFDDSKLFQALKNPHFGHFYYKNSQNFTKLVILVAKKKKKKKKNWRKFKHQHLFICAANWPFCSTVQCCHFQADFATKNIILYLICVYPAPRIAINFFVLLCYGKSRIRFWWHSPRKSKIHLVSENNVLKTLDLKVVHVSTARAFFQKEVRRTPFFKFFQVWSCFDSTGRQCIIN